MKSKKPPRQTANLLDLPPAGEVESVVVKTTTGGPFAEDLFFYIFTPTRFWQIANADAAPVFDWLKRLPDVDFEASILASGCTEERLFVLWRKEGAPNFGFESRNQLRMRLTERLVGHAVRDAATIADGVIAEYQKRHRHYHNLRHINHCLWELDRLTDPALDRDLIELAIWYHDIVYEPKRRDNEAQSIERLKADLGAALPPQMIDRLSAMILATVHKIGFTSNDESLKAFLDIDMAVVGLSPLEFTAYELAVSAELRAAPRLMFRYLRKRFLKGLLAGEIFLTATFREKYEASAKNNIHSLLGRYPYRWIPSL